jgi:hypothetical protein
MYPNVPHLLHCEDLADHFQGDVYPFPGPEVWLINIGWDHRGAINIHYVAFMLVHFDEFLAVSPFPNFMTFVQKPPDSGLHLTPRGHSIEYLAPKQDVSPWRFFHGEIQAGPILLLAASAEVSFVEALTPCIQYVGYI